MFFINLEGKPVILPVLRVFRFFVCDFFVFFLTSWLHRNLQNFRSFSVTLAFIEGLHFVTFPTWTLLSLLSSSLSMIFCRKFSKRKVTRVWLNTVLKELYTSWLSIKTITAQKMKFSIKDFSSKCDQTRSFCVFGHSYWKNP